MTWPRVLSDLLVLGAALLAVDRALRRREHWPLAAVLVAWLFEPWRPADPFVARAWCLLWPALSAWLAVRVLMRDRVLALVAASLVAAYGWTDLRAGLTPSEALLHASVAGVAAQIVAAAWAFRRRLRLVDRCVLALVAGDVAALAGPLGDAHSLALQHERWWLAQGQAAAVAVVLVALHVRQALSERRRRG